jgi:hypothetical protein
MMVVVTVMAVALHLIQTLSENTIGCQMFCLQPARAKQRMERCGLEENQRLWRLRS